MDHDVKSPLLLIGETYDPATPLRNGRRLAHAMGVKNARLGEKDRLKVQLICPVTHPYVRSRLSSLPHSVVHHGYGHASRDYSSCTRNLTRNAILHGVVPAEAETDCYADSKPYQGEADQFGEKEWKALVSEVKAGRM